MKRRYALGVILVVLLVSFSVLGFLWFQQKTTPVLGPKWEEVFTENSGITVSGTVLYSKGNEFIIDVCREDGPTSRAPSLYIVGNSTKIWQKNKWQKLKDAPPVGTVVMMHVPFQQEITGLCVEEDYHAERVKAIDEQTLTATTKQYDISDAYIENRVQGREVDSLAILRLDKDKVQYVEVWPKDIDDLPILIDKAKQIWAQKGFYPKDIEASWDKQWALTGYEFPFKSVLNTAKRLTFSSDTHEVIMDEEFLRFDQFEMMVEYQGKVYAMTYETHLLGDLNLGDHSLDDFVIGQNYFGETYYKIRDGEFSSIYTKSRQKDSLYVWKEVLENDGDSSS